MKLWCISGDFLVGFGGKGTRVGLKFRLSEKFKKVLIQRICKNLALGALDNHMGMLRGEGAHQMSMIVHFMVDP